MTAAETVAYNQGVRAVLALASQSAQTLAARTTRPLHEGFAIEALQALAEAGAALLMPIPPDQPSKEPIGT